MRKILMLCLLLLFAVRVSAETDFAMLTDGDLETSQLCEANTEITLEEADGIESIYLIFDREYGNVLLTLDNGEEFFVNTGGILHYNINLRERFRILPKRVMLSFPEGEAALCELRAFGRGETPDWVQQWRRIPDGGADLLLLSTHGDDEQLFFAGLLPYYGAERGKRIQVAYFTDHRNITASRVHEMLNGLWNVGIRDYPVFGAFPDYYTFDLQDAYRFYASSGMDEQTLLSFVVEQLRRYRPEVVVGHDIHGEYGHGMHRLYTDLLRKGLEISADPDAFPELAEAYGVWDVPKTYLHLYPENPITMDWDVPLTSFNGKTAYEVTRDLGFACHASQQADFAWYFRDADTAAAVAKYNPCQYGLYRSLVGMDVQKNDFFENITPGEPAQEPLPPRPAPLGTTVKSWIYIPAVGTLVLTTMTVFYTIPERKKKF